MRPGSVPQVRQQGNNRDPLQRDLIAHGSSPLGCRGNSDGFSRRLETWIFGRASFSTGDSMPMIDRLKNALQFALRLAHSLSFLAPLATRLVLGLAFFQTGLGKWQNFDNTVAFFTDLGIPFPQANAAFVASLELFGGLALMAGLLTRLAALGLASTMVVALLTADKEAFLSSWQSGSETVPTDVTAFTYLLFLLWLILYGPGRASVDYFAARWLALERGGRIAESDGRASAASTAEAPLG